MIKPERNDLIRTMRRHKICVLVPTYNNAGTIGNVLSRIKDYSADIIVVNDGSTDDTEEILNSFRNEIYTVSYSQNAGKGHALKRGFKKALELGYEYAITIDSDAQHYPEDIPAFVKAIVEYPGTLIVGERDLTKVDINGKSSFANKFSNFWFCVQTGKKLNDTQTGYRAYPLKKLYGLSILTSRYEAELELLVFASWNGVKIISIPIRVYYPPQSERVSHFKPALDFTRISILNTLLCIAAIAYGLPSMIWNTFYQRKIFNQEFKPFTRRKGEKMSTAVTFGRIFRSAYGFSFFTLFATAVFSPFASLYFITGKNSDKKKFRFHKMVRWGCSVISRNYPGAKTVYENKEGENLNIPALIICNHQSHLDLPALIAISPKLVFLTNDWVWNSPIFGNIIHKADFLPVSKGMETIMPKLRDIKAKGYSIVVFPEGTRSEDCSILRFHQGAFLLARELDMDIVPMVIHGAGHFLPKKSFLFCKGRITLKTLKRIERSSFSDLLLRQQASYFRKLISAEYNNMVLENEKADYFSSFVLYKYAWRGWRTVARCKKELKNSIKYESIINSGDALKRVRIINSGIGVIPLLYALVNKNTDVYAFEGNINHHAIATGTPSIPSNLHFIHAVWDCDMGEDGDYDLTLTLEQ